MNCKVEILPTEISVTAPTGFRFVSTDTMEALVVFDGGPCLLRDAYAWLIDDLEGGLYEVDENEKMKEAASV